MSRTSTSKILGVLSIVGPIALVAGAFWFVHRGDKYAISRLFRHEPVTTSYIWQTESPEGISNFREYWDDQNKVVHIEVERLWDHQKKSVVMSAADYKKVRDKLKDHLVPGSEKEATVNP
jgi:hypothetical protein